MGVNAAPDGYRLLLVSAPNEINAALYEKLSFKFIRDIAPIASIHREPHVMVVHPSVPTHTVPELLRYAKVNPGKLNMASAGNGSTNHVTGRVVQNDNRCQSAPRSLSQRVACAHRPDRRAGAGNVATMSSSIEYIRADKLLPPAVTSLAGSALLPDVPGLTRGEDARTLGGT